jgi:hypothetical protein
LSVVRFNPVAKDFFSQLSSKYTDIAAGLTSVLAHDPLPDGELTEDERRSLDTLACGPANAAGYIKNAFREMYSHVPQAGAIEDMDAIFGAHAEQNDMSLACLLKLAEVPRAAEMFLSAAADERWRPDTNPRFSHGRPVKQDMRRAFEELCSCTAKARADSEAQGILPLVESVGDTR